MFNQIELGMKPTWLMEFSCHVLDNENWSNTTVANHMVNCPPTYLNAYWRSKFDILTSSSIVRTASVRIRSIGRNEFCRLLFTGRTINILSFERDLLRYFGIFTVSLFHTIMTCVKLRFCHEFITFEAYQLHSPYPVNFCQAPQIDKQFTH